MPRKYSAAGVVGILVVLLAPASLFADAGPEQGLVVFHRANVMKGKAIRFNIEQDGRPIGQLTAGSEFSVPLDPGTYTFTVRVPTWDGMDYLTLTVEAGKTYTVEGEILWGWPAGRPKFKNVSESGVATQPSAAPAESTVPQPAAAQPAAAATRPVMSDRDAIRQGLKSLSGDWNMAMWSLAADGRKLEGKGTATATLQGDYAVQVVVDSFDAPEIPDATGGGTVVISYHPERGLTLASDLRAADRKLQLSGQYQSGKFVFYLIGGGGETMTGVPRSSVRLEVSPIDADTWMGETFASFEGQTTKVQSTTFTRR